MATEQYANRATTTLTTGIDNVETSLTVTSATAFPTTGTFRILIDSEILIVTAVAGTTFTVTRAGESTTAASHSTGSTVSQVLTRDGLLALGTRIHLRDTRANRPAAGLAGRLFIPTDGVTIDYDTGSAWASYGPIQIVTPPPVVADWTWDNQGGATASETNGVLQISAPAVNSTNARVLYKTAPATPYTITALVVADYLQEAFHNVGIGWRSTGGALALFSIQYNSGGANNSPLLLAKWATSSTASPTTYTSSALYYPKDAYWIRLTDNGTNRIISLSPDGVYFTTFDTRARTSDLTPAQVMVYAESFNATNPAAISVLSWTVA